MKDEILNDESMRKVLANIDSLSDLLTVGREIAAEVMKSEDRKEADNALVAFAMIKTLGPAFVGLVEIGESVKRLAAAQERIAAAQERTAKVQEGLLSVRRFVPVEEMAEAWKGEARRGRAVPKGGDRRGVELAPKPPESEFYSNPIPPNIRAQVYELDHKTLRRPGGDPFDPKEHLNTIQIQNANRITISYRGETRVVKDRGGLQDNAEPQITAKLRNVVRLSDTEHPRGPCLNGDIYGDASARFVDGTNVTTSTIVSEDANVFTTRSGSVYQVENWSTRTT